MTPVPNRRRNLLRTAIGLFLVALALYGAGSLWASARSGNRAAAKEYEYPEISISASPTTVPVGHPVTITWSATNVDTCTAFGEWSGDKPLSGSEVVQPWGWDNSVYALECTGIWGETGDGVFVDVVSPLTPRSVVDQQQVYVDDYTQAAGLAQSFTVGSAGFLTDVSVAATGAYSYDRFAITRVTPNGAPDTAHPLWSTTVLNQGTSGNLHLPKPVLVVPGQRYALVLTAPGTAQDDMVSGEYVCSEGTPHPYTRGDMYVQDEVGGSWTQHEGCDMVFGTYVLQRFKSSP